MMADRESLCASVPNAVQDVMGRVRDGWHFDKWETEEDPDTMTCSLMLRSPVSVDHDSSPASLPEAVHNVLAQVQEGWQFAVWETNENLDIIKCSLKLLRRVTEGGGLQVEGVSMVDGREGLNNLSTSSVDPATKTTLNDLLAEKTSEIQTLQAVGEQVSPCVSTPDQDLIHDHVGTLEKKLSGCVERVGRTVTLSRAAESSLDTAQQEVAMQISWLQEAAPQVALQAPGELSAASAQESLANNQTLLQQLEVHAASLDHLEHQRDTTLHTLAPKQKQEIIVKITELREEQARFRDLAIERLKALHREVSTHEALEADVQRLAAWLESQEHHLQQQQQPICLPLATRQLTAKLDSNRALQAEVRNYDDTVERVTEAAKKLDLPREGATLTTQPNIIELQAKYTQLCAHAAECVHACEEAAPIHRQMETDRAKVEQWVKDTDTAITRPLKLTMPTQALKDHIHNYQKLCESVRVHEAITGEVEERASQIMPHLSDVDQATLKDWLLVHKQDITRLGEAVRERVGAVEEALTLRNRHEGESVEITRLLCVAQEELKAIARALPTIIEPVRDLTERCQTTRGELCDLKPRVDQLKQDSDRLQEAGGLQSSGDEAGRLVQTRADLEEQAGLQMVRLSAALASRQTYHTARAELETTLRTCRENIDAVDVLGVAAHTKLDRYQTVTTTLQAMEPQLAQLVHKAGHIAIETTPSEGQALTHEVALVEERFGALRDESRLRAQELHGVVSERQDFSGNLSETISNLRTMEASLVPQESLEMQVEGVTRELDQVQQKRAIIEAEVQLMANQIEDQRTRYTSLEENIPLELQDKVEEFDNLSDKIKARLQSEEDKLLAAKTSRVEFHAVRQDVMNWLRASDDLLTEPAEGVQYEQVEQELHEHKEVFGREQHQQQLLDRLLDLQEQLTPTLDLNDRSTLRQTVASLHQKVTDSAEAGRSRERQLEENVAQWKDYKLKLATVETFLNDAEDQWETTSDDIPPGLDSTKKKTTSAGEFVQQLADNKDQLAQLNAAGNTLAHHGSQATRTATERLLANVNEKYTSLHTDAENRHQALEKTVETWVTYEEHAKMIGHVMREAQEQLPQAELERATSAELGQHLMDTKGVIQTVQQSSTEMAALQQAAQTVLSQLPLSAAKAAIQAELLTIQDSFERLQWESQDQQVAIETEVAEREKFAAEVGETVTWLQEAQMKLEQPQTMGVSLHEVETRLSATQAVKHDVTMQLDQVQTAIKQLRDKYADESELPPELAQQLETLTHAEDQVTTLLEETQQGLERAQHTRQEYHDTVGVLKSWISDAEEQMAEPLKEHQEDTQKHQRLMQEIEIFHPKLEMLQSYGEELIAGAPEEDAAVVKATVQSLGDRWDQLQNLAVERSSELSEVGELWDKFETTAQFLTGQADYTRSVPKTQLVWDSLEQVEKRVQTQRVVVQEVTANLQELPELEALSKQLEERGVTSATQRVQNVRELLTAAQTESTEHLALIEATAAEWKECDNTLSAVTKFVNEAHDSMEILDDAITLEQKVRASEELLQDLEHHEASLARVAATKDKLGPRAKAGADHPAAAVNIKELRERAQRHHDDLKAQLQQQQALEVDAIALKEKIDAGQEVLSHPPSADSAEELQHKIKEHKDLALQVHGWQTKLHLLNTQSKNIMLRCQDINVELPPELARRTKQGKDVTEGGDGTKLRVLEDMSSLEESRASPVSLQSDDTDALLGEYARVLRSPSDSEEKSETTTLLMAAVEEFAACENMSLADSLESNETANLTNTASTLEFPSASTGLSQQLNMSNINDPTGRANMKYRPNTYTTSQKTKPYCKDVAMETQSPEALRLYAMNYPSADLKTFALNDPYSLASATESDTTLTPRSPRVMQTPGFDLSYAYPHNRRSTTSDITSDGAGVDSDTGYWGDRDIPGTPQSLGSGVYAQSRIFPPTIDELNSAWSRLRVQLEDRLQQQDQHQGRVTDVSRRLEDAAQALAPVDPATLTLAELDLQMQETQEMFLELDVLEAEMRQMEVESEDTHADPESRAAAAASLRMLRDKHASLQAQAHDREHILQNAVDDRAQYSATVHDFTAQVKQLANWLTTARIAHSGEPMVTYDVPYLRQQLAENQSMQAEISSRLHKLAELGMVAEGLADIAAPADAQARALQLSQLTTATTAFKCDALQRQVAIEEALRESERKKEELDDYRQNVASLQSWIQETQKLAKAQQQRPGEDLELRDKQRKLKEQLTSDLQQHQDVLRSVARQAEGVTHDPDSSTPASPEVIGANWRRLSRQLSEKKQQALESSPGEFHGRPLESFQHRAIGGGESTTRLSELQNCIGDLNSCWDKLQGQVTDKQTRLENTLHFQQLYQEALINISAWLDDIEQRLFTGMTPGTDLDRHLQENNNLQQELATLQDQLMQMNRASQQLMAEAGAESHSLISQTVGDLHARLKALEDQAQSRQQELQLHQNNSKQHQDEVADVDQKMAELAAQYATLNSLPLDQRAAMWNQLEDKRRQLEEKMRDLKAPGWNLGTSDPRLVAPAGIDALSTHWGALQQQASQQKVELDEASSTQTQYESMLEEFSQFLETAQEKLKSDSVAARDLKHLEQQCNAHQDFFAGLESHRSLLDALAHSVDPNTRQRFQTSHDRLNRLTQVVQDRANAHGQCLDRLSKQWVTFSAQHDDLAAWLGRLERILPGDPGANHLTIDDVRKQVWDFHAVEKALMAERGSVLQAMDRGRQLQQLVTCPFLNTQVTDFHEKWMNVSNQATEQLKRLQTLTDQWAQFERDAATLETWLSEAHSRVHRISHVEQLDLGNISAINRKMELFLDFRKEVENQQPLKTKVTTMGRQLAHARGGDPQLERRVNQIEDQWMALMAELPDNEEQLHNAQMELLPSRQALSELIMWVEGVEETCREDSAQSPASLMDVQLMLHKYRGLKVDISNRQLTVDFVNQTAIQSSNIEVSSPRYVDKTEFAERLGQMNKRYQSVSSDVAERIKSLEMSELRWQDYEKAVGNLTSWFNTQNEKVKSLQKFGHEVSTQQGLADVRCLQDQLPGKQSEIDNVRKLGLTLVERQGSIQVDARNVHVTMDQVTEQWAQLESRLGAVKQDLDGLARHWETYNHALHECNDTLTHTQYAFTTHTVATGNLDGFKSLIDKLKTIQVEFNNSGEFHEQLTTSAHNLLQVCETPTDASIHRTLDDVNARWEAMTTQLSGRVAAFEDLCSKWSAYESEFGDVVRWITRQEEVTHRLLVDEDTDQYELIENLKTMQVEVDSFRERLIQLAHLSDQLTRHMDNTTVIHLTSREASLSQRLLNIQQGLARRLTNLENSASRHVTFTNTLDKVERFVSDADSILSGEDPASGATANQLRERLEQLKDLSGNFSRMQPDLEGLSAAGPGLALNTEEAARLGQVHQDWGASRAAATVRCSDLQGQLLRQQDFSAKCDEWMLYLAEIERDLSEELAGNYQELTVQKQAYETFLGEMATRQQVLQAIIAEGYQMLRQGSIPDRAGFEHKLCLLEGQWQCVTRRAARKQGQLERQLESWGSYRTQLGQLERKVKELGHGLGALDLTPASLQRTQTLLKDIKAAEREAGLTEPQLQQLNECCRLVSVDSDTTTRHQLQAEQSALHAAWTDLIQQLAGRRESVTVVLALWEKTEGGMDSALQWLRQIRAAMATDIPDNYDGLLRELQHCREFEGEFAARMDQRLQLAAQQEQLCGAVSSQDVGVLQQRLVLLNKQWAELHHQVELRQQAVQHRLGAWTTFNDKYRDLNHSLTAMENKISSSQEFHIEDLLQKLRQDYQQELSALEAERTQLCEQGQLLLQASSDVRASDIDQKLARLDDAWRRLQDRWSRRLRKLEETLSAVQQLEHNMRRLRQWLAHIEHNLGSPLTFRCAEFSEIQQQLTQQQELQRDIEQHSGGVTSVMSLCEVLVHDADACPSPVEQGALQQAISSLSRRWRNICDLSIERRRRIEDTWQLWQQFGDDQRAFVSQLRDLERQSRQARSDTPTLATLRDDLRRTEAFKRSIDERLTALEHLNKQYRRLAREGRADSRGDIKAQIQEANKRYDDMSQNLTAVIRRLRHMIDMRADFDATREALLTWLTDINRRITHIEHFSGASNIRQRLDELQAVEADLENKTSRLEYIEKAAQYLMQKSEATDSAKVQRDLDEFRNMLDSVISNLKKLQSRLQRVSTGEEDEEDDDEFVEVLPDIDQIEKLVEDISDEDLAAVQRLRETPTQRLPPSPVPRGWSPYTDGSGESGDSMAGDQDDPDGDGPASEGSLDDDAAHFTEGREESYRKIRAPFSHRHEKLGRVEAFLRELETSLGRVNQRLTECEQALKTPAASGAVSHTTGPNFSTTVQSCQDSVDRLMTLEKQLKRETGLPSLYGAETQIRMALKRWEKLKEAAKNRDHSVQKTRQQWSQFRIDMDNLVVWLDDAERQQRGQNNPPLNIRDLERSVHAHREFLHQIDARRPVMLSINLLNKDDLAQPTTDCRQLTVQLGTVNQRWDKVCARAAVWQKELQIALVQSTDFNKTVRETEVWLRDMQAQIRAQEPVEAGRKLGSNKRRKFKDILSELEQGATRLRSLQSTAESLLADTNSQESASARERLGYLLRQTEGLGQTCRTYLARLDGSTGSGHDLHGRSPRSPMLHMGFEEGEISQVRSAIPPFRKSPRPYFSRKLVGLVPEATAIVDSDPDIDNTNPDFTDEEDEVVPTTSAAVAAAASVTSMRSRFLSRVCRAAVPIQMLMMLLLGAASLVPMTEEDFSCTLANNFRQSLDPMLRYMDGPPPF